VGSRIPDGDVPEVRLGSSVDVDGIAEVTVSGCGHAGVAQLSVGQHRRVGSRAEDEVLPISLGRSKGVDHAVVLGVAAGGVVLGSGQDDGGLFGPFRQQCAGDPEAGGGCHAENGSRPQDHGHIGRDVDVRREVVGDADVVPGNVGVDGATIDPEAFGGVVGAGDAG